MKFYHTLVHPWNDWNLNRHLDDYLIEQGIEYDKTCSFAVDFQSLGSWSHQITEERLMKKIVVLIDEHELSAIMLSVNYVFEIKNSPYVETKNKFRRMFKWLQKLK